MSGQSAVLVIKLGAFGNVVLSLGAFAAIRRQHARARITLLTTAPYAAWMAASPYFDAVWIDDRPDWWNLPGWLRLRRRLIEGRFDRVYDLQTSSRSNRYFQLLPRAARPEWSGIATGCSHPDKDPDRDRMHDADRQAGQLHQAGIACVPPADLAWCAGDIAPFALPGRFALLAPGSSPHRPDKRWPAERYG
ncbi:MAG TPA: ADP-heptose--LPS heptosyltransferase, partial [Acetobacteraceae bacterium]|nr:ADP-heptose--LPS heptosyltransferase [Acetobacteraceae bacterium]